MSSVLEEQSRKIHETFDVQTRSVNAAIEQQSNKIEEVIEDQKNYIQQNLQMLRKKMKIGIIKLNVVLLKLTRLFLIRVIY
jgi:hypothetical protein